MGYDINYHTSYGCLSVRAAGIVLRGNEVLLAKGKEMPYYLVGGTVKFNEHSLETVKREFFEELGVYVTVDRLIFLQERFFCVNCKRHHEIAFYYHIIYDEQFDRIMEGSYTDQGQKESLHWHPINKLCEIELVPAFMKDKLSLSLPVFEHIIVDETV